MYIIQTENSFRLEKKIPTAKTNLAEQGDNTGVLQVLSILFQSSSPSQTQWCLSSEQLQRQRQDRLSLEVQGHHEEQSYIPTQ